MIGCAASQEPHCKQGRTTPKIASVFLPRTALHRLFNGRLFRSLKLVRGLATVICRQRPGTAKGFVFISVEDETGIANAVVPPDGWANLLSKGARLTITQERSLRISGPVQRGRVFRWCGPNGSSACPCRYSTS